MPFKYWLSVPFLLVVLPVLHGQTPVVAPGLSIPRGALPWALDHYGGKAQLVPIHHSSIEINQHKGANVAGSLAGSFLYKPKMTTELPGPHARTSLHDGSPSFYVHVNQDPDGGGDTDRSESATYALVRANVNKDRRVFAKIQFTQLTGNAKRADGVVDTATEKLADGWLKITPKSALAPGEYALTPIPKAQNAYSTVVYDFTLDPAAPNVTDAVQSNSTSQQEIE